MGNKTDSYQVGLSVTPTNNATLDTDGAGAIKLRRGNPGATTQDLLTFDAAGKPTFQAPPVIAVAAASPILKARHTANQTGITLTAYNKVQFPAIDIDTCSGWDAANNRYKPTVAGWYLFSGGAEINGTAINYLIVALFKNGGLASVGADITGISASVLGGSVNRPIFMNGTTDYVELQFYIQASGAAVNADSSGAITFLDAFFLRP